MADNVNTVTLVGNLTRDAELSYTQGGTAIVKFSLAINRWRKDQDDDVYFFDVVKWKGEGIAQYMTKGKTVAVSGRLTQDRWQDQEGKNRSKVYVTADTVQLLGGKSDGQQGPPQGNYNPPWPEDHNDPAARGYQGR